MADESNFSTVQVLRMCVQVFGLVWLTNILKWQHSHCIGEVLLWGLRCWPAELAHNCKNNCKQSGFLPSWRLSTIFLRVLVYCAGSLCVLEVNNWWSAWLDRGQWFTSSTDPISIYHNLFFQSFYDFQFKRDMLYCFYFSLFLDWWRSPQCQAFASSVFQIVPCCL